MCPYVDNRPLITTYYQEHRDELMNYVTRRIGMYHLAEDLVQDVFLRLLTTDKLIAKATLPNLAYTTANHLICDFWRHRRSVEEYEHIMRFNSPYAADDTASVYSVREMVGLLERGVSYLSDRHRTIYRMNVYGGMKVSEISSILQLNYKSVENVLGESRRKIRNYMRRMYA